MIQMSRGYEDEKLIFQVFLMFANRADIHGKFGPLTEDDPIVEYVRMSEGDLQVLLICILYYFDKEILAGFTLYDRQPARNRTYKLDKRKDF